MVFLHMANLIIRLSRQNGYALDFSQMNYSKKSSKKESRHIPVSSGVLIS